MGTRSLDFSVDLSLDEADQGRNMTLAGAPLYQRQFPGSPDGWGNFQQLRG